MLVAARKTLEVIEAERFTGYRSDGQEGKSKKEHSSIRYSPHCVSHPSEDVLGL